MQGFHAIIAMQRNELHWLLSDDDAKRYGAALANALRHMPIKAAQKTIDYSTLAMVAFVMETPRVVRSVQIARTPRPQPPRGPAQVFYPFAANPSPNPPPPGANTPQPAAPTTSPTSSGDMGSTGAPPMVAEGPQDFSAFGGEGPPAA